MYYYLNFSNLWKIFTVESANQLEQIKQGFEDPKRKEARTLENSIAKFEELQAQYIH